ncbi:hypothetical protein PS627_03581 [Pseudomonas fluorescens]|nr:hypothetical protein PS627_03581 [Pseudomonas fluorescens]VVP98761.1 hypothetical protein PS910_03597 [Pseudomonas fluorescens]
MQNSFDAAVDITVDSDESLIERLDDLVLAEIARARSSDVSIPVELENL